MTGDTLEITAVDDTTDDAKPLPRQVIVNDDARLLKRAFKLLMSFGIGPLMVCNACKEADRPEIIQWARTADTNDVVMVCGCRVRILEGMRS